MTVHPKEVHPIEIESYRRMRTAIDFSQWRDVDRAVVERMVHATADEDYATSAHVGENAVLRAIEALRSGARVITDANMVRVGLVGVSEVTGQDPVCFLDRVSAADLATAQHLEPDLTRSAFAIRQSVEMGAKGAVFVIGNAPTALFELLRLVDAALVLPAAVIGLPVGFVGATESKEALRASSIAHLAISNTGRKGGSAVAAATLNALVRLARETA